MIYIVTQSDHYYPSGGAYDWVLVTRDRESAEARCAELGNDRYRSAYLIAINEDNLHVRNIIGDDE